MKLSIVGSVDLKNVSKILRDKNKRQNTNRVHEQKYTKD